MNRYECWAWVERLEDDSESIIAVVVPGTPYAAMPMVSTSKKVIDGLGDLARSHTRESGRATRLVHLVEKED